MAVPIYTAGISFFGHFTVGNIASGYLQQAGVQQWDQSAPAAVSGGSVAALSNFGAQMIGGEDGSLVEVALAAGAVLSAQLMLGGNTFRSMMEAGVPYKMIAPLYTAGAAGLASFAYRMFK